MFATLIVLTAVLLAAVGLRAERRRRTVELWACNAAAAALLAATVAGHAVGRLT
ncbi:MAG: hypothetical protein QOE45_225 [Frankiaceae bacterium]|jgi:hypothetical protein|nr:hypothetical protein [Frankiaceae bacterium]